MAGRRAGGAHFVVAEMLIEQVREKKFQGHGASALSARPGRLCCSKGHVVQNGSAKKFLAFRISARAT